VTLFVIHYCSFYPAEDGAMMSKYVGCVNINVYDIVMCCFRIAVLNGFHIGWK